MNSQNFFKFLLLSLILMAGLSFLANSSSPAFADELGNVQTPKWTLPLSAKDCKNSSGDNCHWGSPVLADINGDNFLDIVAVTNNGYVFVVRHNGQSLWKKDLAPAFGMAPETQEIASSPAVADIDGDGFPEIVVGAGSNYANSCTKGGVIVLDHNGNVQPGWPKFGKVTTGSGCPDSFFSTPALADLNGDGKLEVVIGGFDKRIYAWDYQGNLMPGFPAASEYSGLTFEKPIWSSPALIDLTRNGRLDILIGTGEGDSQGDGSVYGLTAEGQLLKRFSSSYTFPRRLLEQIQSTPAVADVNNDGYPEIFVGTGGTNSNGQDGNFLLFGMDRFGNDLPGWEGGKNLGGPTPASPAIGDIDGDGDLEIIMASMDNKQLYAFHANGQKVNGFPMVPLAQNGDPLSGYNVGASFVLADYDNDPNKDMEIFLSKGWGVAIIDGNGQQLTTTNFPNDNKPLYITGGTVLSVPAVGDIDNDGKLELIVTNSELTVWDLDSSSTNADWPMFKNNPARTSSMAQMLAAPNSLTGFHQTGQDGDAETSFVISNMGGVDFEYVINTPAGVTASPASGTVSAAGKAFISVQIAANGSIPAGVYNKGDLIITTTNVIGGVWGGNESIPVRLIVGDISNTFLPVIVK